MDQLSIFAGVVGAASAMVTITLTAAQCDARMAVACVLFSAAAWWGLQQIRARFYYVPYVHALKN